MADNISTGIGLSGQFDYSQTGLEPILQAERDLAGRRAQEQQQKNKERKALEDEVRKMALMDHGLKIPLYQRQWESAMTGAITDIVEKVKKGDDDAYSAAWNLQRKMKNYTQDLKAADEELYGVYEAVRKNPEKFAWNDPQEIRGKKYNNFFEVLKDPEMADVNNMKEAMKYYGGTEYLLQENDPESVSMGAPPFTVHYNPQEMVNPLDHALKLAKEKAQYDQLEMGKPFAVGGKMRAEEIYRMSPETIGLLTDEAFQNMGVLRSYEERLFQNRPDKGMTRAEFQKTDWIEDAKALHEQEIKPQLQRMVTKQGTIDVTPSVPREVKPSDFQKGYNVSAPIQKNYTLSDGSSSLDVNEINFIPRPGQARQPVSMQFPEGTLRMDSDGDFTKAETKSASVTPAGIVYVRDHTKGSLVEGRKLKAYFKYDAGEGVTYMVPLAQGPLEEFTARTGAETGDIYGYVNTLLGGDEQVKKQFKEFWGKVGVGGQGTQGGSAPTQKKTGAAGL
jgi:hypothetical protein